MKYWQECIECAFDEAGIAATPEQIKMVAGAVETSHECYGMAFGHDCIPNPTELENKELKRKLEIEKSKTVCPECKGRGYITENFCNRSCTSRCDRCAGEGKIIK